MCREFLLVESGHMIYKLKVIFLLFSKISPRSHLGRLNPDIFAYLYKYIKEDQKANIFMGEQL